MLSFWFGQSTPTAEQIVCRLETERVERELAMHQAITERNIAKEIAVAKHRLFYTATGGAMTLIIAVGSAWYHKNWFYTWPVAPIFTAFLYEANCAYGIQARKVIEETNKTLLRNDLKLAPSPISLAEIDARTLELIGLRDF